MQVERQRFYQPEEILREVQCKLEKIEKAEEKVDYLTFVPDGEPTLDTDLEKEILLLQPLGIPIAYFGESDHLFR